MTEILLDLSDRPLLIAGSIEALFPGTGDPGSIGRWIDERRDSIGLIYFHNRPAGEFAAIASERGLPRPDAVIADEGASIQVGGQRRHVVDLEEELVGDWPGRKVILEALPSGLPLKPMRGGGEYAIRLASTTKSGEPFPGLSDLRSFTRKLGARVRLVDDHLEIVPARRNPSTALLGLLPRLGIGTREAGARMLVFPNTALQAHMLYLGFRSVITLAADAEVRRRGLTAPRAYVPAVGDSNGFFDGLRYHFGWGPDSRIAAVD